MKIKRILLLLTVMIVSACCAVACDEAGKDIIVSISAKSGALNAVTLETPYLDEEVFALPTFEWSKADNADTYEFELCSNTSFTQADGAVYVKKTGITENSLTLSSVLKEKNAYYYWRVSAVNASGKQTSDTGSFYLKADEKEIEFDVNYADEWTVHEQGSNATVSIDESDFFNNGKNSLTVGFVEEDTKRGIDSSDGWIVVTHSHETEMYGVDAFYFNFYYSGNDADVYLRVVDEDNEYWHAQLKVANNAKQTIIIKFDDFELRTKGGTTIANKVFDYNYIKYIELVFEKSFGDGVAMMSDLRAIKYENYTHLFVDRFEIDDLGVQNFIHDNYNFDLTVSDDGNTLNYAFSNSANENNNSGVNGWGFVKIPVERLLVGGDAFVLDLTYEGNIKKDGSILIRAIEEDGDRWVYTQKLSKFDGGKIVIPYKAFLLSEYKGDGVRQFYYLKQLQLGISNVYSTGSVTVKDMRITEVANEVDNIYCSEVYEDGLIDDFDGYANDVELYYKWMLSETNKDEAMAIEKDLALGSGNVCAKLGYKADMGQALYATYLTTTREGFDAFSVWAMDASVKSDDAVFNYIPEVNAQRIVSLYLINGQEFSYVVNAVSKSWTKYVIAFENFTEVEGYFGDKLPLISQNLAAVKIGFQYYYYAKSGNILTPYPKYISKNYVYLDNVALTEGETAEIALSQKLMPSEDDPNVCVVADFDNLSEQTLFKSSGLEYDELTLSALTATGIGQSLKMRYQGKKDSVSYSMTTAIDESVKANCVKLLIKGDGKATIYVNIYMDYQNGDQITKYKYRYAITGASEDWTVYTIGFDKFGKIEGSGDIRLTKSRVKMISKISFGIVNSVDGELSYIYLDKMVLDGSLADR